MDVMTPRDIQLRIRSGDSLAAVIDASGLPADRVEAFAAPILAERDHATLTALASPVRRRGETASARRLRQTVAESLLDLGQDIDYVTWDSWRRSDGRWIVQGTWRSGPGEAIARFLYDAKGRFSVADNDQARSLVGDLPLFAPADADQEPTVQVDPYPYLVQSSLAEETTLGLQDQLAAQADDEDSLRSDIDLLYDMISTIDEDSVRIFRGLREPLPDQPSDAETSLPPNRPAGAPRPEASRQPSLPSLPATPAPAAPAEPAREDGDSEPRVARRGRRRASVPSWDDIIFGGQS